MDPVRKLWLPPSLTLKQKPKRRRVFLESDFHGRKSHQETAHSTAANLRRPKAAAIGLEDATGLRKSSCSWPLV